MKAYILSHWLSETIYQNKLSDSCHLTLVVRMQISAAEISVIVVCVCPLNHLVMLEQMFIRKVQGLPLLSFKELIVPVKITKGMSQKKYCQILTLKRGRRVSQHWRIILCWFKFSQLCYCLPKDQKSSPVMYESKHWAEGHDGSTCG